MSPSFIWAHIAVMAGVTYAIRALPLLLLRREIRNRYLRAFLRYVPYATLSAMTLPDAITAVPHPVAGVAGVVVAALVALLKGGLLLAAAGASIAVALVEWLCFN